MIVKTDFGKSPEEITDTDLSSVADITREFARTQENIRTDHRTRYALLKLDGTIVHLRWSPAGLIHMVYPIAPGATCTLNITSTYLERLGALFRIAIHFFRPRDSLALE